jgi:hypothetical protein
MKKLPLSTAVMLLTLYINFCFAQSNFYYGLENQKFYLTEKPGQFLIHTNVNFAVGHLGNCKITPLNANFYITDNISNITNREGIEYITNGLQTTNGAPFFVTKDITLRFRDGYSDAQ